MSLVKVKKYRNKHNRTAMLAWGLLSACMLVFANSVWANGSAHDTVSSEALLQFTAQKHVLSFQPDAFIVAGADHVLNVAFVDAKPVVPQAQCSRLATSPPAGQAHPMKAVTYENLWPGVSLVFDSTHGIVESFYHIAPETHPSARNPRKRSVDRIRLRYNVPVSLDQAGNLMLAFETGQLRESAPLAWQQIAGRRVPVPVAFRIVGHCEVGFDVAPYNRAYPLVIDPVMTWNTFMGAAAGDDHGRGIALDADGNIYVAGRSDASWGTPVNPYQGNIDAFVAKLDSSGNLVWHTFLGSAADDWGYGVRLDSAGDLYVAGYGNASWGTPVNAHTADTTTDAFVARLNSDTGQVVWNTFLGSSGSDYCYDAIPDAAGYLYVAGRSTAGWGAPVNMHAGGGMDVFIAKLDANTGQRIWHTFMGSAGKDYGYGLAVGEDGYIYAGGRSNESWGTPVNGHTGSGQYDAFLAELDGNGDLIWHTFMGSAGYDYSASVAVDNSGNAYLAGYSDSTWGAPLNGHAGGENDAFVAKFAAVSGDRIWHTFMGSDSDDRSSAIALDAGSDLYVIGYSDATWGAPANAHAGSSDGFSAKLDHNGNRLWNTFMGSAGSDLSYVLSVDAQDNVYIAGRSSTGWGTPVNGYAGGMDTFVLKLAATYKLTVNLSGIGGGRVTSTAVGIDCGRDCIEEYDQGTQVTLTPTPDHDMEFSGWAGIGCAGTGVCTITMDSDRIIRAHFTNPTLDTDLDGISDTDEQGPLGLDTGYDGNSDGIADWDQAEVVSSPSAEGSKYVTFSVPDQVKISAANTLAQPPSAELPEGVQLKLGLFEYVVTHPMQGDTIAITFRLPDGLVPDTYYKFGPTPDNPIDHWYQFLYDGTTGAEINRNVITLHFKDGQRGDSDLNANNGIIADPGGPGFFGGGGTGGGCFLNMFQKIFR